MPIHVFLALWEDREVSRSWGWDTRAFVLSSERRTTPQPRGAGCPGLEHPVCPGDLAGGTSGPLIDGTNDDLRMCQLTSELLSLALRLLNVIADSSVPTLSSRMNDAPS